MDLDDLVEVEMYTHAPYDFTLVAVHEKTFARLGEAKVRAGQRIDDISIRIERSGPSRGLLVIPDHGGSWKEVGASLIYLTQGDKIRAALQLPKKEWPPGPPAFWEDEPESELIGFEDLD